MRWSYLLREANWVYFTSFFYWKLNGHGHEDHLLDMLIFLKDMHVSPNFWTRRHKAWKQCAAFILSWEFWEHSIRLCPVSSRLVFLASLCAPPSPLSAIRKEMIQIITRLKNWDQSRTISFVLHTHYVYPPTLIRHKRTSFSYKNYQLFCIYGACALSRVNPLYFIIFSFVILMRYNCSFLCYLFN